MTMYAICGSLGEGFMYGWDWFGQPVYFELLDDRVERGGVVGICARVSSEGCRGVGVGIAHLLGGCALEPVVVLDVRDASAVAPVDHRLPPSWVRGEGCVPVRIALRRLGGHVHPQRLELLRDECGILPVVGERNRIVDGELDYLTALGPAIRRVGTVAISA